MHCGRVVVRKSNPSGLRLELIVLCCRDALCRGAPRRGVLCRSVLCREVLEWRSHVQGGRRLDHDADGIQQHMLPLLLLLCRLGAQVAE